MKISREWATPLTIGSFALMAITGVLMFFHLDTGLNKTAHEWLGWVMVAGVVFHGAANWAAFKRYFTSSRAGRGIMAASVVVIAATFAPMPAGGGGGASPPALAIQAISTAPLTQVAGLAGRPVEQVMQQLQAAGIAVQDPAQSLAAVVGKDRERIGRALAVLFGSAGKSAPAAAGTH